MTPSPDDLLFAFRTNMVVTASAGTGKTFRLVTLYALLTLGLSSQGCGDDAEAAPPLSPPRIAATTFSRAAAAEIRDRVERLLRAVANASDDQAMRPYLAGLEARALKTGSPLLTSRTMRERARAALGDLPHALIDTLHGLAARLLRDAAIDLGVTPAFSILDEQQARASTETSIDEVLSDALERGDPGAMALLDAGGGLASTRTRISQLLDRADEEGVSLDRLACTDFEPMARTLMLGLRDLCVALATEESKTFAGAAREAGTSIDLWLERGASEEDLAVAFEPLFARRSPARALPSEEAFLAFRDAIRAESNAERGRRLASFVANAPHLLPRTRAMSCLLADMARRRTAARWRTGALGFGDLLRTVRDAVRDHPAVAMRARAMFDALVVDEFQDTSRVQRDLIYLLREKESAARLRPPETIPTAADLQPHGLLIVGDRKQSIYGFRGADVTVFTRVCAELAGRPAILALELKPDFEAPAAPPAAFISLSENRRSHPSLLEFVNAFAESDFDAGAAFAFDIHYAEAEHLRPPKDVAGAPSREDGSPRIVIVEDGGELPDDAPALVRGASGPMREAIVAAGLIDRAVRDGSFGPISYGDIAVLARRRATLPLLEFALGRLDVPYFVAGRGLFETREVRDVFAVLRLLLDPFDRHALATVLRGPALALTDASLALLSEPGRGLTPPSAWFHPSEGGPARALPDDERSRLAQFASRFAELRRIALGLGPGDAIRYAVEALDLDRVAAALPRPVSRLGNVERLIALASQNGGSLPAFVRWLEQQIADQSDESEAVASLDSDDAVTLTTIHASKGLEFSAVVLVDMGAGVRAEPLTLALASEAGSRPPRLVVRHTKPQGGSLFTPEAAEFWREASAREVAERRRLTYVAMTRAKERLFLLAPPAAPNGSAAATLRRLLPEAASRCRATIVESAVPYLIRLPRSDGEVAATRSEILSYVPSPPSDRGPLAISTTPLATFDECPRRYRLMHEMGVEPPPFDAPGSSGSSAVRDRRRALGTAAHRVLEIWPLERWGQPTDAAEVHARLTAADAPAERLSLTHQPETADVHRMAANIAAFLASPYAAHVREAHTAVYREEPFVIPIASDGGPLFLRGTIDLLVQFDDGSADVVDYKSSWLGDLGDSTFQLRAYALAARRVYGLMPVRAGLVNLGSPHGATYQPAVPNILNGPELDRFERHLATLRGRFLLARSSDGFDGVAPSRCAFLRCGFLRACHTDAPAAPR